MSNGNSAHGEDLAALQHRSQVYRGLHNSRIGREFKLVLSTITFFMVCAGAKLLGKIPAESSLLAKSVPLFDVVAIGAFVFVCVMSFLYLKGSAAANDRNQKDAEVAEDVVARYFEDAPPHDLRQYYRDINAEKKLTADTRPNRHRWIWQWVVIVAGAVFSAILILLA